MRTENDAVEERYFRWLYAKIGSVTDLNPARSHWLLAERMHQRIFEVILSNDENRESDGTDLRDEFCDEYGSWENSRYIFEPCSMLEMVLALAKRMHFQDDGSVFDDHGIGEWFWKLMRNVELAHLNDAVFSSGTRIGSYVDDVLDTIIYRRYDSSGKGGLFPLRHPNGDQRKTELWYQMNQYMIENS